MIVSPITKPADNETLRGCVRTYLPEGDWYDFFTNDRYIGGRVLDVYRKAEDMPVFVKAGGIVPMTKLSHINDIENPENMRIKVYAGADNILEMYEDDGESLEYKNGKYAITKMQLLWGDKPTFVISKPQGDFVLPKRNFEVEIIGINENTDIKVTEDNMAKEFAAKWQDGVLNVSAKEVSGELRIMFERDVTIKKNDVVSRAAEFLRHAETDGKAKEMAMECIENAESPLMAIADICNLDLSTDMKNALTEIITADTYNE